MAFVLPYDHLASCLSNRLGGREMLHRGEGQRCHAKRGIRGHQGFVSAECRGTIEGEIENLGRHLIAVRWDNGLCMYVFPDEIDIDENINELSERARW
jgi:hypothetical protein